MNGMILYVSCTVCSYLFLFIHFLKSYSPRKTKRSMILEVLFIYIETDISYVSVLYGWCLEVCLCVV